MLEQEDLETAKVKIENASSGYYAYNDNYATAKFKVTKKADSSGAIKYMLGEGDNAIEWKQGGNFIYDEDEKSKDEKEWEIWLDLYYEFNVNTQDKYDAKAQNCYLDEDGDFDPEKDGWKGEKNFDKVVKEATDKVVEAGSNLASGIAKAVDDFIANFINNIWWSLISAIMDAIGNAADGIQNLANLIQMDEDSTVLYSYDELTKDSAKNMYTNVGSYKKGAKVVIGVNLKKDENDNNEDDFSKDTKIPVMVGDLYNVAVGHIDFLDINFLTEQNGKKSDGTLKHEQGSVWLGLRNFASTLIHICIYASSAILIVSLIWFGLNVVRSSFDNPMTRAESKRGLERFETSLLMLIGSILIMAVCIFGTQAFASTIQDTDTYELPIRVNVEDTYSFSTTVAGYTRYISLTSDTSEWMQKSIATVTYYILAHVNLIVVIFMIARVFILWFLSMSGPIIAALNVFGRGSVERFTNWAIRYGLISLIQVGLIAIYKVMLLTVK